MKRFCWVSLTLYPAFALYTSYSRTSNEGAAKYNAAVNGTTDKFFNVGVRHKF